MDSISFLKVPVSENNKKVLKESRNNKNSDIFKKYKNIIEKQISTEKTKCIIELSSQNGNFYQHSKSKLKKNWNEIENCFEKIFPHFDYMKKEYGMEYFTRQDINKLKNKYENQPIKGAIEEYLKNEKIRDENLIKLQTLLGIEKATYGSEKLNNVLLFKKQNLLSRQLQLIGSTGFNGLINIAWKNYSNASEKNRSEDLAIYNKLDEENRSIIGHLWLCDMQINTPPSHMTVDQLTENALTEKINQL